MEAALPESFLSRSNFPISSRNLAISSAHPADVYCGRGTLSWPNDKGLNDRLLSTVVCSISSPPDITTSMSQSLP